MGVVSLESSSSVELCSSVSEFCVKLFEEDGRGSSICTTIELSQQGQNVFLFSPRNKNIYYL